MKQFIPVLFGGTIAVREFMTGPINKEMPEPQAHKSARTKKKKASKKLLQTLVNHFAK